MVRLHFNESALRYIAQTRPPDREGRLLYRTSKDSYRERWFRLCGNLLFYFRTNDLGAATDLSDPLGVLVLAACRVQMEEYGDRPFVFSMVFDGEDGRKHFFSGQSQRQCVEWVDAVRNSVYGEVQAKMASLQLRIKSLTGRDPLLDDKAPKPVIRTAQPSAAPVTSTTNRSAMFYRESAVKRELAVKRQSPTASLPTVGSSKPQGTRSGAAQPACLSTVATNQPAAAGKLQRDGQQTSQSTAFSDWETFT